ncbi:hypothetical protein PCANC_04200 [Puccinia coronata f. sp. avenae]|uniref:DASH complex subunit DAD2 n=1 Tax=Puccinia coronata f. sp. avenae TaxID=200324 RepID=A0A2N5TFA2_9BASI|nr:hypothetical protein PCASD_09688 [Puccinia coronata f. sp. avenae]PLW44415.1 hypothetical protein PCASD_04466 [Puccinia coronata f. sp. avenae]PLW54523.1 hypothetical protein PCANC_04200 [Puccinia coronata f. sp. avenae]
MSTSARPTTTTQRLVEKQKELEALVHLNQASHAMTLQLEHLSVQFNQGKHGAVSIESVVQRWQNVFRAAHLAIATRAANHGLGNAAEAPVDMLVRIPVGTQQDEAEEEES